MMETSTGKAALIAAACLVLSSGSGCGGASGSGTGPGAVPVPEAVGAVAGTERDRVVVGWMPGAGQGYEVAWRIEDGAWSTLGSTDGSTFHLTYALPPNVPIGTRLGFRVRTNRDGTWSDWSPEARWTRPRGAVIALPDRIRTGGTVRIRIYSWLSALSPDNPSLELAAGSHPIAVPGPLPWPAEIAWDTATVPEGNYALAVRLEGGAAASGYETAAGQAIVVDRSVATSWTLPAYYDLFTQDTVLHIGVSVTPRMADAPPPSAARLWAGPILIAEFGAPPWPPVEWDTRAAPEGDYPIQLEVPNYSDPTTPDPSGVAQSFRPLTVHVDRTRPRITCEPPRLGQASGWTLGRLLMVPDEHVTMAAVTFTDDRTGAAFTLPSSEIRPAADTWPPRYWMPWGTQNLPPYRVTAEAIAFDRAGWPAQTSCAFDAPAWLAPWGEGPITAGGEPVVAEAFALEAQFAFDDPNRILATLAWIPRSAPASPAPLQIAREGGNGFGLPASLGTPGGRATSVAVSAKLSAATGEGDPWIAWTEAAPGGKARPRLARWDGSSWVEDRPSVTGNPARDAGEIALSICAMAEADGIVAWTEVDEAGRSSLLTGRLVGGAWQDVQGSPGAPLPEGARTPAMSTLWRDGNQTVGTPSVLLAFIEAGPSGPAQVRAAEAFPGTGWIAQAAVRNLDLLAPASDPTAVHQHESSVAWVENGRVLVRETDLFFNGLTFGEATVLNTDPARRARSPRAARSTPVIGLEYAPGWRAAHTIYFVEEGPGGDEIWARRRHGSTWELLPGPLNAGIPGRVLKLTAIDIGMNTYTSAVAWLDDEGHVYVRVANP